MSGRLGGEVVGEFARGKKLPPSLTHTLCIRRIIRQDQDTSFVFFCDGDEEMKRYLLHFQVLEFS